MRLRPEQQRDCFSSSFARESTFPYRQEKDERGKTLRVPMTAAIADRAMTRGRGGVCSTAPEMECHSCSEDSTAAVHRARSIRAGNRPTGIRRDRSRGKQMSVLREPHRGIGTGSAGPVEPQTGAFQARHLGRISPMALEKVQNNSVIRVSLTRSCAFTLRKKSNQPNQNIEAV